MPTLKTTDSGKWIQGIVATGSIIFWYVFLLLLYKVGEWTELDARFHYFEWVAQFVAAGSALALFIYLIKRADVRQYLDEVFNELIKVVWPDRSSTTKLTIGIIIALIITSIVLGIVDFGVGKILGQLYKL